METLSDIDLAALRIVKYPDPVLSRRAEEADPSDPSLAPLAERMMALMYAARGVGLAAPQVGVGIRMFVANPAATPGEGELVVLNPEIADADGAEVCEEGCLSLPGVTSKIRRYATLTLRGTDLDGRPIEREAEGLLARIFQHETDHLDGLLITERMTPVGKLANRKMLKQLEDESAAG
jgi:peptide deformylase